MDKLLNKYVVIWLAGLITGLVLLERWHRAGQQLASDGEPVTPEEQDAAATTEPEPQPADGHHRDLGLSPFTSIVTGAKADLNRVRQKVAERRATRSDETTPATS